MVGWLGGSGVSAPGPLTGIAPLSELSCRSMPRELPMLPAEPSCPAALKVEGASRERRGVVCRIMQADQDTDPGLDMNPRQLEVLRETQGGVYLNLAGDPSTVAMFCHGSAVPVITEDQRAAHYSVCPVWQEDRDRYIAGKRGLFDPIEPEPVSMGVSSLDAPDPWAQARADLDLLAPEGA